MFGVGGAGTKVKDLLKIKLRTCNEDAGEGNVTPTHTNPKKGRKAQASRAEKMGDTGCSLQSERNRKPLQANGSTQADRGPAKNLAETQDRGARCTVRVG